MESFQSSGESDDCCRRMDQEDIKNLVAENDSKSATQFVVSACNLSYKFLNN